jgi:four helix bundle protein
VGNANQPQDIAERTLAYAVRAVRLYQALQNGRDGAGWVMGKQFLRAGTAIGANVAEAQSAESRADFIHKLSLAQKEARESAYWLEVLRRAGIVSADRLTELAAETNEIVAVLSAIIVRTKQNAAS